MDIHFECTRCGQCCHDLKLPLTIAEAIAWLADGHTVEVLCDAAPWSAAAGHRQHRSFMAHSGTLPVRIVFTLVAAFSGACPNLASDLQCTIYPRRPLVCRIYPAEIRPGLALRPDQKSCPPQAWAGVHPIFVQRGQLVDASLRALIQRSRDQDTNDVPAKERLCAMLGLDSAAVADE